MVKITLTGITVDPRNGAGILVRKYAIDTSTGTRIPCKAKLG